MFVTARETPPEEETAFTTANYWREDLPQLDFDALTLDDNDDETTFEPQVVPEPELLTPDESTETIEPEIVAAEKNETQAENENAAGDSPSKDTEESSTPDAGLYEALVSKIVFSATL